MEPTYQTLIFIKNCKNQIWLAEKKRNFGTGKLNGYGGKVQSGETITKCILRELEEETSLNLDENEIVYLGYIDYHDLDRKERRIVYIYTTIATDKCPTESEEMGNPKKYTLKGVPYQNMWPDTIFWLHLVFNQRFFKIKFVLKNKAVKKACIDVLNKPQWYKTLS